MTKKYAPGFMPSVDDTDSTLVDSSPVEMTPPDDITIAEMTPPDDIIDVSWRPIQPDTAHDANQRSAQLDHLEVAEPIPVQLESVDAKFGWLEPEAESTLIPAWGQQNCGANGNHTGLELVPTAARAGLFSHKNQVTPKSTSKPKRKSKRKKDAKNSSTALERHVNDYIVTDDDMETAKKWLERVNAKPHTQQQLTPSTHTQVEPLTALWAWLKGPSKTKTATQRKVDGSFWLDMSGELGSSGTDYGGRWYFICERDPNETDELYFLRHWFMQVEFAEGTTEWSEQAFMDWVASLSADERKIFAEAGGQIAGGHWQQHVNDSTSELIDTMRESQQRSSVDTAVDTVVNAFLRLF
ncbi:MAG: hypothetical protein AAF708_14595 [Deinococcota bacterium]